MTMEQYYREGMDITNQLANELTEEVAELRRQLADATSTTYPIDREFLGQCVRREWVRWAKEQGEPKPHWLVPWGQLSVRMREVDRRIGEHIAGMSIAIMERELTRVKRQLATARAEALKAAANHDDYDPGDIVDNGVVTFTAFRDYVRRVVRNANAHWRAVLSLAATPTVPTPRKPRERTVSDGHCRPITSDKQDDPSLIDDIDRCIKKTLSGISLQHPSAHKQALTNQVVILQAVKMILEDAKTPPAREQAKCATCGGCGVVYRKGVMGVEDPCPDCQNEGAE